MSSHTRLPGMDHRLEIDDVQAASQILRSRYQNLLWVLIICFWIGLIDWRAFLTGMLIVSTQSPFTLNSSRFDITIAVESGKYILNSKLPNRTSSLTKQMAVTLRRMAVSKLRMDRKAAASNDFREVQVTSIPSFTFPPSVKFDPLQIAPETIRARTTSFACWISLIGDRIPDELKKLDSRVIRSFPGGYDVEEEDEEAPQMTPRFGAGVVLKRLVKPEVIEELTDMLSRLSIYEEDIGGAQEETAVKQNETNGMVVANNNRNTTIPIILSRRTPRISEAERLRYRVTKVRSQGTHTDRVRRLRLQAEERSASSSRSLANQQAGVDADGGMSGLELDEQAEEQQQGGGLTEVQTGQQTVADSAVETGQGMVGLEVEEQAIDRLESGEVMGVSASQQTATSGAEVEEPVDEVNEVMIGSDVDGVIEVDEETPDSDSGCVHGDSMNLEQDGPRAEANETGSQDTMRLEQDGPQVESNETGNPDTMRLEQDGQQVEANETGNLKPMNIEPQSDRGKVNEEKNLDRIRREREEIALRQKSASAASSGEMIVDSVGDSAEAVQQHAAPVPESETGAAAANTLNGDAQNTESSDRAQALRKARLGKKAESKAAPEEVAGPSRTGDGDTSDTTSPTKTPNYTPPSSTSSTPPKSPPTRNMASVHDVLSKPASAKGEGKAPKKEKRKRGGDSSDEEEASGGSEKVKVNQGDQSVPGPVSQNGSPARKMRTAKTVKQEAPKVPDSGPSSRSRPETTYPAESSKRAQQKRPDQSESDEGIVCLNDMPDKTLTKEETEAEFMQAAYDLFPYHDTVSSDDEKP